MVPDACEGASGGGGGGAGGPGTLVVIAVVLFCVSFEGNSSGVSFPVEGIETRLNQLSEESANKIRPLNQGAES